MIRCGFAIPGDIDLATGGYAYDRRVLALLPEMGIDVEHMVLTQRFPAPTKLDLCATAQALAAGPSGTVLRSRDSRTAFGFLSFLNQAMVVLYKH